MFDVSHLMSCDEVHVNTKLSLITLTYTVVKKQYFTFTSIIYKNSFSCCLHHYHEAEVAHISFICIYLFFSVSFDAIMNTSWIHCDPLMLFLFCYAIKNKQKQKNKIKTEKSPRSLLIYSLTHSYSGVSDGSGTLMENTCWQAGGGVSGRLPTPESGLGAGFAGSGSERYFSICSKLRFSSGLLKRCRGAPGDAPSAFPLIFLKRLSLTVSFPSPLHGSNTLTSLRNLELKPK